MSWLSPWMLLGLMAAGIPIALHFLYRNRYRRVPWAAMRFLRLSIEQTSRRLRFQELVLLILRVTALVALALALARPVWRAAATDRATGRGDAVDAVFLIDASYSMSARDGQTTRFERARAAALAILDGLPAQSTVQIIRCSDRAELLGPLTPSQLGRARTILQELDWTHEASDLHPGVVAAAASLRPGVAPNKEVYLFSDHHRLGWDQQRDALIAEWRAMGQRAATYFVRCATGGVKNATLLSITPEAGIPHVGERAAFTVLVRNHGSEPLQDLTVGLHLDGQESARDTQNIPLIGAAETRAVTLTCRLDQPGEHVLTATLRADELEADNRLDYVIHVRDRVRVLVVDGSADVQSPEKSSSYFLLHALRPVAEADQSSHHVQVRLVSAAEAAPAMLVEQDVCILANVLVDDHDPSRRLNPAFIERLREKVSDGLGLWIFAGESVLPDAYNSRLSALLPAPLVSVVRSASSTPWNVDATSADATDFLGSFREPPLDSVKLTEVEQVLTLGPPDSPMKVLLRTSAGHPLVVARKVGNGEVILVTTSSDAARSNWCLLPTYVPFVHLTLGRLVQARGASQNLQAGEPLRWRPPSPAGTAGYRLLLPGGGIERLAPDPNDAEGQYLVSRNTHKAGIYGIRSESPSSSLEPAVATAFAVNPNLRESDDLSILTNDQIDARLGFSPIHLAADENIMDQASNARQNWEWTKWLIGGLLLMLIAESAWAWHCGRGC